VPRWPFPTAVVGTELFFHPKVAVRTWSGGHVVHRVEPVEADRMAPACQPEPLPLRAAVVACRSPQPCATGLLTVAGAGEEVFSNVTSVRSLIVTVSPSGYPSAAAVSPPVRFPTPPGGARRRSRVRASAVPPMRAIGRPPPSPVHDHTTQCRP